MRPTTCSSSIILPRKPQQKECCIQKKRRILLPAAVILCVDQIVVHHLHCPISDAVHLLYPQHLILRLELLGDTLAGRQLFFCYQIVINADNKKQQAFRRTPAAFKYFRIIQHILSQKTLFLFNLIYSQYLNFNYSLSRKKIKKKDKKRE